MGYDTHFSGHFELTPQPTAEQIAAIQKFHDERHDAGNPAWPDDRLNVHGEFVPAIGPRSPWCQWTIIPPGEENDDCSTFADDRCVLAWDGSEKFYEYAAWLRFLEARFFTPWGIRINGEVEWQGEDTDDCGKMVANASVVTLFAGTRRVEYRQVEG